MEDVDDELASGHETVGDEFARADGYWRVGLVGGGDESPLVYVDPSNRRWCHPSHSSPLSIALSSWMAIQSTKDAVLTILRVFDGLVRPNR